MGFLFCQREKRRSRERFARIGHMIKTFIRDEELLNWQGKVSEVHNRLHQDYGESRNDMMLGWLNLPVDYDRQEFERIKLAAEKIRNDSQVLVVIGIGGSYLGSKAVIEALTTPKALHLGGQGVEVLFAGNNLSSKYLKNILKQIEGKEVSLNVISKSGTTIEPALAFRILREWMENKYGDKAYERIYATTDKENGVLKKLATQKGYETFVVPNDIGGRYSVLTAVGLLPIAVTGININELMDGAKQAMTDFGEENILENGAYKYAVARNIYYTSGKLVEILANYEPSLHYLGEWWKQLFGESEGKDKKGIMPASVDLTTDLHSMGQFIQDGNRILFETVLNIEEDKENLVINEEENDSDGLNFLAGNTLDFVNKKAMEGTIQAHIDGGTPNIIINLPRLDEYNLGYLIYFWQKACAMSGYLLRVNPFDQPGVEVYKKNMFALLKKEL